MQAYIPSTAMIAKPILQRKHKISIRQPDACHAPPLWYRYVLCQHNVTVTKDFAYKQQNKPQNAFKLQWKCVISELIDMQSSNISFDDVSLHTHKTDEYIPQCNTTPPQIIIPKDSHHNSMASESTLRHSWITSSIGRLSFVVFWWFFRFFCRCFFSFVAVPTSCCISLEIIPYLTPRNFADAPSMLPWFHTLLNY